ncbi:hypothetical protein [Psychroserpens sp.]|uniref:hypothetical protein n=1 Tax=Psychroserpens sp. TaxID=2020870 RepID=UPI002B26E1B1|nr:hypothetical protein [Psychroserpens sp.]
MDVTYKKFYRGFYANTGYIPTSPLQLKVYPGDFFQIHNGQMLVLGNIYNDRIVDIVDDCIKKDIAHSSLNWSFNDGVTKPYSARGTGTDIVEGEFEFSKQTLKFNSNGSYLFKGNNPKSIKIANWDAIQDALIIKLTQVLYSFREVYVVTETATTSECAIAIASSKKGKLQIATDSENFGLVDFFGHPSSKTIKSKNIEFYNQETKRKPMFFKAQRLTVREEQSEAFISDFISKRDNDSLWANSFFDYELRNDDTVTMPRLSNHNKLNLLDLLQANQLNPNTALSYFKWTNADLNDIEKFF